MPLTATNNLNDMGNNLNRENRLSTLLTEIILHMTEELLVCRVDV